MDDCPGHGDRAVRARPTRVTEAPPPSEDRIVSEYLPFDIFIDRGPTGTGYRARVLQSPAGEAMTDFALPFTQDELTRFLPPWPAGALTDIKEFGTRLFQAVFAGSVGACLRRSIDQAERRVTGLRIRLRFDSTVPELTDLPWESLYAAEMGGFLALSNQTPIIRYLELPRPVKPVHVRSPLTVLAVIASPSSLAPLDIEREWAQLQAALEEPAQRGLVRLERLANATLATLQARLRQNPVHILHFVGHGFYDQSQKRSGLVFEDEAGRDAMVSGEDLGMLLTSSPELRLIFLSTSTGTRRVARDSFADMPQTLVRQGIPAVLAMRFPLSDAAAIALVHSFYSELANGLPVDLALAEARKAMSVNGENLACLAPVLYSRSEDSRLFELLPGVAKSHHTEAVIIEASPDAPAPGEPPYKGLDFYDVADANIFFGREKLTAELVAFVREHAFLAIVGTSGSGKSSLARAGLVAALLGKNTRPLEDGVQPPLGSRDWRYISVTPTAHPFWALARGLARDGAEAVALQDVLAADPLALADRAPALAGAGGRLLLLVDQFEELFTLCKDEAERTAYVNALLVASGEPAFHSANTHCTVILTLRADFYAQCIGFENLRAALETHQKPIGAMNRGELQRTIELPAQAGWWAFQQGLVELILEDVGDQPGNLPLLSYALLETWHRRSGRIMTLAGYQFARRSRK